MNTTLAETLLAVLRAHPLRAYYLDLTHLEKTGKQEVLELLEAFWLRYARHDRRAEALASLGLADPVADTEIKRRYRELAMEQA